MATDNGDSLHADGLDRTDRLILTVLQANGRISNQDLAQQVHLSPAQCNRRHKRLEALGYIRSYETRVDADRVGLGVTAFVHLTMERGQFKEVQRFQRDIGKMPEVLECHAVTGDVDYVCKVVARDLKSLSDFLLGRLAQLPGVNGVRSSVCLNELKSTHALPLV
jgi:Lrp/AsnC family transcriptional regulator, leucine-responsive regulatory protein